MRAEVKNKIFQEVIRFCGLVAFITQLIQFFTGRWEYDFYLESSMLIIFLGISLYPKRVINIFKAKFLNTNINTMTEEKSKKEEEEEVKKTETAKEQKAEDTGGSLPDKDEEV